MYNIIHLSLTQAHNYKTEKSIYNIITGKKSHQTFFDACSQQLLSLYHSLPNLKYPSFVGNVHDFKMNEDSEQRIRVHPRHTYDSLLNTFKAIQLLVQTVSNTEHGMFQFIPVTHHSTIQQRVKAVYKEIKNADTQYKLIEELNVLFKSIIEKNNTLYIHYYLQGFEESMYTRQQISLIENVSQKRLFELELNDLVMMMFELSLMGVSKPTIIIWLLLFRIFYYIVPLIIAGILFLHDLARQVNDFFDGLPLVIIQNTAHFLITAFMYISGILMLLAAAVPDITADNKLFARLYPFTFFFIHQLSTVLFAIAMLACARGLASKVQKAYWPTLALLLIGIISTWWNLRTMSLTIYLAIVLVLILLSKRELYRAKLQYSISKFATDLLIFAGSCILYVIVGVLNAPQYTRSHKIPNFFLFPGEKVWFSGLIGLLLGLILLVLILRYFCSGADPFAKQQKFAAERVHKVIEQFGGSRTSHLAFLKDKNLYFYQKADQDQLYFMYRRNYDRLIIMGDPVGNVAEIRPALRQFLTEADLYNYQLVFYEVSGEFTMLLHEFGFDFIKTGETGLVRLADFTLAGKRQRSQRALMHKFDREGYQFNVVKPPFDDEFMQKLKAVSDDWLGKQVEKGFSLGFFSPNYIQQAPVATVTDQTGKIVAFATFMPTGGKKYLTIDLMRHTHNAPSGIMDKIFISMFLYGQEHGYEYFDLGMAPLSNVGESQFSFIEEKAAHFIYEYGYHLYGFQGLRRYKDKYATAWYSRYTAFRKKNSIIATMMILVSVVNQRVDQQTHRSIFWWLNK